MLLFGKNKKERIQSLIRSFFALEKPNYICTHKNHYRSKYRYYHCCLHAVKKAVEKTACRFKLYAELWQYLSELLVRENRNVQANYTLRIYWKNYQIIAVDLSQIDNVGEQPYR
jgi:hypothetical protein